MNRKIQSIFALFFLLFLALCAFQCFSSVLQKSKGYMMNGYDKWMKSRKVRGGLRCLKDHGFGYTIKRVFSKRA